MNIPVAPRPAQLLCTHFFFLFSFPPTRILEGLFLDLLTLYKPTGSEQHKQGIVVKACVYATQNFRSPTTAKFEESCLVQDFSPPQEQPASTDWWKKKKRPPTPCLDTRQSEVFLKGLCNFREQSEMAEFSAAMTSPSTHTHHQHFPLPNSGS